MEGSWLLYSERSGKSVRFTLHSGVVLSGMWSPSEANTGTYWTPSNLSPAPLSLFKLETSSESFFNSLASELSVLEDVIGLTEKKHQSWGAGEII